MQLILAPFVLIVVSSAPRPAYELNVLDFGANGFPDNVDNTAAFQSALDAAAHQHGAIVVAPAGIYRFTDALMVHSGVTLKGFLL